MIYLDYNSTTPVLPEVLESMLPWFTTNFGNAASSTHVMGKLANSAVEQAREEVAALIKAEPNEIVFTAGSTEAINLGITGCFRKYGKVKNHLITVATEHKAVLDTMQSLKEEGAELTILPVDEKGAIDPDQLREAIKPNTLLAAIMMANNETGYIHPVEEFGQILEEKQVLFFCDATQAALTLPINVKEMKAAMLCISSHKIYGPKGAGALYLSRRNPRVEPEPLIHGGGHERGYRSGTLNVPALVGFGKAASLTLLNRKDRIEILQGQRTFFLEILESSSKVSFNSDPKNSLINTINFWVEGLTSSQLLGRMPDLALSSGSACTSANPRPSHVLEAMDLPEESLKGSVRLSVGITLNREEMLKAGQILGKAIGE